MVYGCWRFFVWPQSDARRPRPTEAGARGAVQLVPAQEWGAMLLAERQVTSSHPDLRERREPTLPCRERRVSGAPAAPARRVRRERVGRPPAGPPVWCWTAAVTWARRVAKG